MYRYVNGLKNSNSWLQLHGSWSFSTFSLNLSFSLSSRAWLKFKFHHRVQLGFLSLRRLRMKPKVGNNPLPRLLPCLFPRFPLLLLGLVPFSICFLPTFTQDLHPIRKMGSDVNQGTPNVVQHSQDSSSHFLGQICTKFISHEFQDCITDNLYTGYAQVQIQMLETQDVYLGCTFKICGTKSCLKKTSKLHRYSRTFACPISRPFITLYVLFFVCMKTCTTTSK